MYKMSKHGTYLKGRNHMNFGENDRKRFGYFRPTIYQNQVCVWRGLDNETILQQTSIPSQTMGDNRIATR